MHWLDWFIVVVPLVTVIVIGLKSQKYVKTVADFLAAGRVAGRYVTCVAGAEASMGLISLVATWEQYYKSGFAFSFWSSLTMPLGLLFSLTGYCTYRFRETKAMTMGQFMEMRYNRSFRIFAAIVQSISGIVNYAIFPAVGARAIIYFLDLPHYLHLGSLTIPTFGALMLLFLGIAIWIITMGGQVTIMVTDCVQGLVSYPLYAIIVIYIIYRMGWNSEIIPSLQNRDYGESMINPYDITYLRDFNLFYICVGIFSSVFNRMSWSGSQGYQAAALNAHEQKMGGLLGTWRAGFCTMMYILLAVAAFTFLHHVNFKKDADKVRAQLTQKTAAEFLVGEQYAVVRQDIDALVKDGTVTPHLQALLEKENVEIAKREAERAKKDLEDKRRHRDGFPKSARFVVTDGHLSSEQYSAAAAIAAGTVDKGKATYMSTIYTQMLVPVALRDLLPIGITGALCAIMLFLMISTDTTYLHSWGSILVQDIILPIRGKPFSSAKQQINLLRICIAAVAIFAFFFSFFFSQMDYILMFFSITGAIWTGGAGPCIVLGLYWRRGTPAAAFSALIGGSSLAVSGMLMQNTWAKSLYPWLERHNLVEPIGRFLHNVSRPFNPIIVWEMNSKKFPINSQELSFLSIILSVSLYVIVSLLTCRKPFNLEKLLHRGAYSDGKPVEKIEWSLNTVFKKIIGIDGNYTKGDRILAYAVFVWSFIWSFGILFIGVIIANAIYGRGENGIYGWPEKWWAIHFGITQLIVPFVVAVISTVWFTWGGTRDLRRLFQRLAAKHDDFSDDGMVRKDKEEAKQ